VVIRRGEIYWVDLGEPAGSRPAKHRPMLVVQAQQFNDSRLATVLAAVVTSNTRLATMPGNVFLPAALSGLPTDSVVDVTGLITLDRAEIGDRAGALTAEQQRAVDRGLRRVLGL
jgi:mRNA interferase MazF